LLQSCISVVTSVPGKAQTELGEGFVDIFFAQHHWGLDLDDIMEGSICAQENSSLPLSCLYHVRVAMPNMRDVVHQIEVLGPVGCMEVLHLPSHYVQRGAMSK
jgi:hypothetical protein